jgi:hypothetical protein
MTALLLSPRVRAESAEAQVERLAAEATLAYRGADYNRAVELLQRAYEIRQVPALLYNMARAYDKLGDVAHAYQAYRRYADCADADLKLKARADARMVALEEMRGKRAAARLVPSPPEGQRADKPAAHVEPSRPPPSTEELRAKRKAERDRQRRRDRFTALGVGSGGVALGVAAIVLSANALALQNLFGQTLDPDRKQSLKSWAQISAGLADGFYAATAVAAGLTAYFLYRGFRAEPNEPLVAPSVSGTSASVVVQGRF